MPETLPLPLKAVPLGKVASPQAMPEGVPSQRRAFAESGAANAVDHYVKSAEIVTVPIDFEYTSFTISITVAFRKFSGTI